MTIAAKLSRKLYETFGDEAENMVDWMQGVDAHRAELRELNDLAFDRFDARLGERLAELRQELHAELHSEIGKLGERLDGRYADLIKWSFVFWVGSAVTLMLGMAAIGRIGR